MEKLIYEIMYDKLIKIGIINQSGELTFKDHIKVKNSPYMDLNIDRLSPEKEDTLRISIAHNFIQNGDLMADPDMEIRIYPKLKAIEALTYQLDSLGIYQIVYPDEKTVYPKRKKDLNRFLNQWLSNIIDQGFKVTCQEGITS
jgi:uncharacterized protein YqiB (DUF1249 family)